MTIFLANQKTGEDRRNCCLLSPKCDKDGRKRRGYELMKEVHKGDFILSNTGKGIKAIGVAEGDYEDYPIQSDEQEKSGWKIPVTYYSFSYPIKIGDVFKYRLGDSCDLVVEPKKGYLGKLAPEEAKDILSEALREEKKSQTEEIIKQALKQCNDDAQLPYSPSKHVSEENPFSNSGGATEAYCKNDFCNEVYMDLDQYEEITSTLKRNKNLILQGPPGVGKTFVAKRLAWSMIGEKDETRIEFVQFHQSYTYEDFVRGYKASGDGFELKDGIFYRFCQEKARSCPNKDFFFIIDEINRGNLSKIFGELLMGIEKDHREENITLEDGTPFLVPKNLYIIGMMNTADRSLAMLDYALRRRFSVFNMGPAFQSAGFKKYCKGIDSNMFSNLIATIEELNNEGISKSLGEEFCIGHSYFCGLGEKDEKELAKELHSIVKYDIIPTLKEYWFDDETMFEYWKNELNKAVDESK